MAKINLTSEGKFKLSRNVKFQQLFEQALIEWAFDEAVPDLSKRGDLTTDDGQGKQALSQYGIKRIRKAQQIVQGNIPRVENLISGLLQPFGEAITIDLDKPGEVITKLAQGIGSAKGQQWYNAVSGVLPNDETKVVE